MIKEDEAVIQQSIYVAFNNKYCLKHHSPRLVIHSVPNGLPINGLPAKERAKILDKLHKTGMLNGVADLNIKGVCGRYIEVEVKTSIGRQSEDQIEYESRIIALGGRYILVHSLNEFWVKITPNLSWLIGKE